MDNPDEDGRREVYHTWYSEGFYDRSRFSACSPIWELECGENSGARRLPSRYRSFGLVSPEWERGMVGAT
jgi:hypothetical protein